MAAQNEADVKNYRETGLHLFENYPTRRDVEYSPRDQHLKYGSRKKLDLVVDLCCEGISLGMKEITEMTLEKRKSFNAAELAHSIRNYVEEGFENEYGVRNHFTVLIGMTGEAFATKQQFLYFSLSLDDGRWPDVCVLRST